MPAPLENMVQAGDPIGWFLAWSAKDPFRSAVDLGDVVVTYAELEVAARRLAGRLPRAGTPRVLVALPTGMSAYAAVIATLLSGGCYVPVNVSTPINKLARIVGAIRPDAIIAEAALASALGPFWPSAWIVDPAVQCNERPLDGIGRRATTAYIIMTSGSTGSPKGVVISTAALVHYIEWLCGHQLFNAEDRLSQFNQLSFDVHVLDIFGALSVGATMVPPMLPTDRLFPAEFIKRSGVTVWASVPSVVDLMIRGQQMTADLLGSIRRFIFCGEPLRPSHLAAVFKACPEVVVTNAYGPTETTVTVTAIDLHAADYRDACTDTAALGNAITGMHLHLFGGEDADEGEIVITGPQLATEYWDDPARTAQAFRIIMVDGQETLGYFSGDWGQRIGRNLFFRGRIDEQVKIKGYRVETGEVVARLADCGWPIACVLKYGNSLVAVVEAEEMRPIDQLALRARLQSELDAYAVPEAIVTISSMPYTANGKLDQAFVRTWLTGILGEGLIPSDQASADSLGRGAAAT